MGKLMERLHSCQRALATLDEAVNMPFSVVVRDASIQRFEYSFESLWKLLKAHLEQHEGIRCHSPKRCFREALQVGLLSIDETDKRSDHQVHFSLGAKRPSRFTDRRFPEGCSAQSPDFEAKATSKTSEV